MKLGEGVLDEKSGIHAGLGRGLLAVRVHIFRRVVAFNITILADSG